MGGGGVLMSGWEEGEAICHDHSIFTPDVQAYQVMVSCPPSLPIHRKKVIVDIIIILMSVQLTFQLQPLPYCDPNPYPYRER